MSLRALAALDSADILANDGDVATIAPPVTRAYQWSVDGVEIVGATAASYAIPVGGTGTLYSCEITSTNLAGVVVETIAGVKVGSLVSLASLPVGAATWSLSGLYSRVGSSFDAQGIRVPGDVSSLALSLSALATLGLTDPELLKAKGWAITVAGVSYNIGEALLDRMIDLASLILKRAA